MIASLMKVGVIFSVVTFVTRKPELFLEYLHYFALIAGVVLILLYVGGLKSGLNYLGILLVVYTITRVIVGGFIEPASPIRVGEYIAPVVGEVTSKYGPRSTSLDGFHYGLDIAVPTGTKVKASKAGTVSFAGYKGNIVGNVVEIDHNDGTQTMYAHNNTTLVTVGEYVEQGEAIAYSGNTGRSTGPHVHFEIRLEDGKKSVDPSLYLK